MIWAASRGKRNLLGVPNVHSYLNDLLHRQASPFLFVGSGISRRYFQTDDWEGLLRHFASEVGRAYEYYRASADGDFPQMASRLAEDFHELWWSSPTYSSSRDACSAEAIGRQSALKIEVASRVRGSVERMPTGGIEKKVRIPRVSGQPFRLNPATRSDGFRPPLGARHGARVI